MGGGGKLHDGLQDLRHAFQVLRQFKEVFYHAIWR
jgi:hypothetical protein